MLASGLARPASASARKPATAPSDPTETATCMARASLRRPGFMIIASAEPTCPRVSQGHVATWPMRPTDPGEHHDQKQADQDDGDDRKRLHPAWRSRFRYAVVPHAVSLALRSIAKVNW